MRLNWKDGGMNQEHATFTGLADLNDEVKQLSTPLQYFPTVLSASVGGAMSAGVSKTRVFCSGVDVTVMPLAQMNIKIQETRKVVFSNQHSYAADA